jgi:hypothetical protein
MVVIKSNIKTCIFVKWKFIYLNAAFCISLCGALGYSLHCVEILVTIN